MGERLRFLTDEDVPRSTARMLREHGYDAADVRDVGLRGAADREVYEFAQREGRILISCDLGFANVIHYPPGSAVGIVVVRIPDQTPIDMFNQVVARSVKGIGSDLKGHLAIVELDKVRLRGR